MTDPTPPPGSTQPYEKGLPVVPQHPSVPLHALMLLHDLEPEDFVLKMVYAPSQIWVHAPHGFNFEAAARQLLDPQVVCYRHVNVLAACLSVVFPDGPAAKWWHNFLNHWNAANGYGKATWIRELSLPEQVLNIFTRQQPYNARGCEERPYTHGLFLFWFELLFAISLAAGLRPLWQGGGEDVFLIGLALLMFASMQVAASEMIRGACYAWPDSSFWPQTARGWLLLLLFPPLLLAIPGMWVGYLMRKI